MQERYPLSVGLYLNSFQISCDLSRICSSKTSHAPSSQDSVQKDTICLFSAKRPLTCLLQQNILSQDSFQKNITWHNWVIKKNPEISTSRQQITWISWLLCYWWCPSALYPAFPEISDVDFVVFVVVVFNIRSQIYSLTKYSRQNSTTGHKHLLGYFD